MSIEPITSIESSTLVASSRPNTMDGLAPADALYQAQQVAAAQQITQIRASQSAVQDLNGISFLTAGDRDFLDYLYGPQMLQNLGVTPAAQAQTQTPQFLLDLIDDRRSGVLPIGTEITSTYVRNQYDVYLAATGTAPVPAPLTANDLQASQDYFDRRVSGAALDLQA
jgi:hypothetical protein